MNVPLRIYFDKTTGQPLQQTGNFTDAWLKEYESVEVQIPQYKVLFERSRDSFDVIEFPFGAFKQDFEQCNGYRVNPVTRTLEFSYPDPNAPQEPPVYQPPLTEQVITLKERLAKTELAAAETSLTLQELIESLY